MRAAVTGATGLVGGPLVDRLISDGHHVTALVRNASAIPVLKARGVAAIRGDVQDQLALERAMMGAEVVFHLARARSHGLRPREVFEVNVAGTRNVVRAAVNSGVVRIVHCSSVAVYGSRPGMVDETAPLRPDSAYSRSKVKAEAVLKAECAKRIAPVIARISTVLGPGADSWLRLFHSVVDGKLRLPGAGANMHHPVDVSDVVDGLVRCAFIPGAAGNTYNIAGPAPLSLREMRTAVAQAVSDVRRSAEKKGSSRAQPKLPYPRAMLDLYYRLGQTTDLMFGVKLPLFESVSFLMIDRVLDITRARRELGYNPQIGFDQAARRTAEWFRQRELF